MRRRNGLRSALPHEAREREVPSAIDRLPPPALPATPPPGIEIARMEVGGTEYAVLTFPAETAASSEGHAALTNLTAAERAVVAEICAGRSNAAIATSRRTSPRTIANQLASIYRKLGVASRFELVALLTASPEDPADRHR
jgi:DNA-binding CsgD family transcriptional regulator